MDVLRTISLARHKSFTSALELQAIPVVTGLRAGPARRLASVHSWRPVSTVQPILPAIDVIADHSEA